MIIDLAELTHIHGCLVNQNKARTLDIRTDKSYCTNHILRFLNFENSKRHLRQTHKDHTEGTLGKQDEAQSSAKCTKSVRQLIPDRVESFEFVVNFNFIVVGAPLILLSREVNVLDAIQLPPSTVSTSNDSPNVVRQVQRRPSSTGRG
jgi:hypothetical protein